MEFLEEKFPDARIKAVSKLSYLVLSKEGIQGVTFKAEQASAKMEKWKWKSIKTIMSFDELDSFYELAYESSGNEWSVTDLAASTRLEDSERMPAIHFLREVEINLYTMSETEFRQFILNSLPYVNYVRPVKESDRAY